MGGWAMSQTTIEDRCRGVLIGLAAGDRIGGPIRMALLLAVYRDFRWVETATRHS
jgi:hypothetical protein